MDYISHVLPMLGEERVEQRAVDELVAASRPARRDGAGARPAEGRRADGGRDRGRGRARCRSRPTELLAVRLEGVELRLSPEQVAALLEEAQAETAEPRRRARAPADEARARVLRALHARGSGTPRTARSTTSRRRSARGGFLNRTLDALWPRPKPEQLVRRLLTSPEELAAAADGILDEDEQRLLQSGRGKGWSDADLPLLDEARALLEGADRAARPPDRRRGAGPDADAAAHARAPLDRARSRSSATSPRRPGRSRTAAGTSSLRYLGAGRALTVEELRLAYRVPRDVMELALPLLPLIAPDVAAADRLPRRATSRRASCASEPEHLVAAAVREAGREALRDGRTALIAPREPCSPSSSRSCPHPDTAFDELAAPIQALTPRAAKGLEFDRVVLVEPARIVAEATDRGATRALRRADARDEDARRRPRRAAAGGAGLGCGRSTR